MRKPITAGGVAAALLLPSLCLVPAVLWALGYLEMGGKPISLPPSIAVMENMTELATTRVHLTDTIEGENNYYQGKWLLHGDAILGVDLSKVAYLRTDPDRKEAVLSLPPPHLISSKVDHDRSAEMAMEKRYWIVFSDPKALRDEVWKEADHKLQRLAVEANNLEPAKAQAERVLRNLFDGVGWRVQFAWQTGQPALANNP